MEQDKKNAVGILSKKIESEDDSLFNKTKSKTMITVIIVLLVVGVILWLINSYVPMDAKIKTILNVVVVIIVIVWLLKYLGALTYFDNVR